MVLGALRSSCLSSLHACLSCVSPRPGDPDTRSRGVRLVTSVRFPSGISPAINIHCARWIGQKLNPVIRHHAHGRYNNARAKKNCNSIWNSTTVRFARQCVFLLFGPYCLRSYFSPARLLSLVRQKILFNIFRTSKLIPCATWWKSFHKLWFYQLIIHVDSKHHSWTN